MRFSWLNGVGFDSDLPLGIRLDILSRRWRSAVRCCAYTRQLSFLLMRDDTCCLSSYFFIIETELATTVDDVSEKRMKHAEAFGNAREIFRVSSNPTL